MNETCKAEFTDLTHPVTVAYIDDIGETLLKTLKKNMSALESVKVSNISCDSVKTTLDLYFLAETRPEKTESIMMYNIQNEKFPASLKVMKSMAVKAEEVNRCNFGSNPCGDHGKCIAGANFTHTCYCNRGYGRIEGGVCVKLVDGELALKVGLPVVIIIVFITYVVLLAMKRRSKCLCLCKCEEEA